MKNLNINLTAGKYLAAISFFVLSTILKACTPIASHNFKVTLLNYPKAEAVIETHLPEALPEGQNLYIEILDDVTGLYFNASRHAMAALDEQHYYIRIPLNIDSELKYRYVRIKESAQYEANPLGQQVRFRIARINGPIIIHDEIFGWVNEAYAHSFGKITGQVIDKKNNTPIPNLLVVTAGMQAITASDGTFLFEQVTPGLHNIVIYSMDGRYDTFQQEALVETNFETPVVAYIDQRELTNVTFTVKLPNDYAYDPDLPLRFVSNLHSLGNAYTDLAGGASGNSVNFPILEQFDESLFRITLELPIGTHLRYKYSFGDGFWNAELNSEGSFALRDLVVTKNSFQNDEVMTFISPQRQPVRFEFKAPPTTPEGENIGLQLNPFSWMEPLPMQRKDGKWYFVLYSPTHLLNEIEYRFCRNLICPIANIDSSSSGKFLAGSEPQLITASFDGWKDLESSPSFSVMTSYLDLVPRPDFVTGVELVSNYPTTWDYSINNGINAVKQIGADWLIFSPTWTLSSDSPTRFEPLPTQDLLWDQLLRLNTKFSDSGFRTILFPKINYTQSTINSFAYHRGDDAWKKDWLQKYSRFILQNADLASLQGVPYLIVGDPTLIDLEISDEEWADLLLNIRTHYSGQIIGFAGIFSDQDIIPQWLNQVDGVFVLLSPCVSVSAEPSTEELVEMIGLVLDEKVLPIFQQNSKPVFIGLMAASRESTESGITMENFLQTDKFRVILTEQRDEISQARLFNAAVVATAKRSWVSGFFAAGYSPYLAVNDTSYSIYAKPASDALWFWYHYLLNK